MGTPTPLTKAQQVQEIIKCGKDPTYFIKKYVKIQHPTRGTLPFETYPFQDECVEQFQEHRLNIVLKSRQLGLSTVCAAYAVWMAIFYKDKNILVIATKLPTAMNFIKKVKFALDNLPSWLLLPKFEPTKQSISFSNGSQVTAIPTSDDAGRSEALSLLIIDEAAFIRDFDTIWTGLAPTFSTGGSAIILSTPNGVGGQYYRLWMEAEAGQNDFNHIRIPWDKHPEHDQAWFDKETKSLPRRKVSQEYLCDFHSSGDTFLQPNDLEDLRAQILDPIAKEGHDRNVWVWSPPIGGHTYVVSADVSRGDAHDYSAFHVIDTEDCEVCAEYMGKVPPEKLADMLHEWGKKYNDALIVPENNTFGYFVNVKLRDAHGYKKLYYANNKGDPFNYIPNDPAELPGFPTNQKSRVQILAKLEELIRNKTLKVYSRRLYDQLQAFIWNGNKPMASKDSYDDLIMSLAIGCWLVEGGEGVNEQARAMAYAMLEATHVNRRDVNQMPGNINEAQPLVNPNIKGYNANSVYRPRDPSSLAPRSPYQRDVSDFSWLNR
jgi:hypothetical protein